MKSVLSFLLLSFLVVVIFGVSAHAQSTHEVVTSSDIYWVTRFDAIRVVAIVGLVLSGFAVFVCAMASMDPDVTIPRWLFVCVPVVGALSASALVFVPTTREAVAMAVIPKIANNADVQGLGADTVNLAREWLDELRPASKKEAVK